MLIPPSVGLIKASTLCWRSHSNGALKHVCPPWFTKPQVFFSSSCRLAACQLSSRFQVFTSYLSLRFNTLWKNINTRSSTCDKKKTQIKCGKEKFWLGVKLDQSFDIFWQGKFFHFPSDLFFFKLLSSHEKVQRCLKVIEESDTFIPHYHMVIV